MQAKFQLYFIRSDVFCQTRKERFFMAVEKTKEYFLEKYPLTSPKEVYEKVENLISELDKAEKKISELEEKVIELKKIVFAFGEKIVVAEKNFLDIDGEIWRDVAGYEGFYRVSNFGRVKSFARGSEKILRQGLYGGEYFTVSLNKNKNRRNFSVHRLVAEAFIPNPNYFPVVNHKDGNKKNNFVENLEWVTQGENLLHASRIGLRKTGADSCNAKLTEDQVRYIRKNYKPRDKIFGAPALAKKFNVGKHIIFNVVKFRTYKDVKMTDN